MSVRYVPVSWTRSKWVYDAVLLAGTAAYLATFFGFGRTATATDLDEQTLAIRAYGTCAFVLLTLVLAIGPLARLDRRFLPLLYNRRHFGVLVFAVALAHASSVLDWYFANGVLDPFVAVLSVDADPARWPGFSPIPFGVVALVILAVMAVTSHDFWLFFLGAPLWKALHMGVYAAYALLVAHVAFGALQDARNVALATVLLVSCASLLGLHVASALVSARDDREALRSLAGPDLADGTRWLDIGPAGGILPGGSLVVRPDGGEAVAIFNDGGRLSAISNLCAHQNGPLAEGRIVDGCVVCPWHGYQYRLADGRAPAPFTEKLATYRLALRAGRLLLDPLPQAPGTPVAPVSALEDAP